MRLESMYQEIILDHYRSPHRRGLREPFDVEVHHVNPTCGDEVTLRVLESVDDHRRRRLATRASGCSISQASTSVMTDLVVGRPLAEALETGEAFRELMQSPRRDASRTRTSSATPSRSPAWRSTRHA